MTYNYFLYYVMCILRVCRWSAHIVHIHRGTYVVCIIRMYMHVCIILHEVYVYYTLCDMRLS